MNWPHHRTRRALSAARSPFGALPRRLPRPFAEARSRPRFTRCNAQALPAPWHRASATHLARRSECRRGRCPDRPRAAVTSRRPQEPHPLRQSASPVDVPYDERDGRRYSNPHGAVKGFSIYADKSWGCAARFPLRASPDAFHSTLKIRKSEVVHVNQGLIRFCESLRGCTAVSELHGSP